MTLFVLIFCVMPLCAVNTKSEVQRYDLLSKKLRYSKKDAGTIVLTALSDHAKDFGNSFPTSSVMSGTTADLLELFTTASDIDHTHTTPGRILLRRLLLDPLTDTTTLRQRQRCIQTLVQDDVLYHELCKTLTFLKENEDDFLLFFNHNDPLGAQGGKARALKSFNWIDKSPLLAGIWDTARKVSVIAGIGMLYRFFSAAQEKKHATLTLCLGILYFLIFNPILMVADEVDTHMAATYARQRIRVLQPLFSFLQTASNLIPEAAQPADELMPLLSAVRAHQYFLPPPSYLQTLIKKPGDISHIVYLISFLKPYLNTLLASIGFVDVMVSCATLLRSDNRWSMPVYTESNSAFLHIQEAFHPHTPVDEVVTQSSYLRDDLCRSYVITGVNRGGKSYYLKTICSALVLGQTLGIVPAASAAFTPFESITALATIHDNTAQAQSRFTNTLSACKQCLDAISHAHRCFVITDELFNNTNYRQGAAFSYAFVRSLIESPNCLSLCSSHYQILTALAADANDQCTLKHFADAPRYQLLDGPFTKNPALATIEAYHMPQHIVANFKTAIGIKDE